MSYHIVSYCSENYADAYDFVIDSWVKTKADRIFIYTDTDKIQSHHPKVLIIPFFQPSTSWLDGVERKVTSVCDYVSLIPGIQSFAFMDIDCFITKDIGEVFGKIKDIGITRLLEKTPHAANTVSAAPWYANMTPGTRQFIEEWQRMAQLYKLRGKGVHDHKVSFVQYSMTDLLRAAYEGSRPYKVYPLDKKIYNCEDQEIDRWIRTIKCNKSKVLHFKRRRFRNKNLIDRVFQILEKRSQ